MAPRVIVWFSCGASSAVAAKLAIDKYGDRCQLVYCDTLAEEHPDNTRFMMDVEEWLDRKVILIKSPKYNNVSEVFDDTKFLANIRGARCTTEMKKVPRWKFQKPDDIHIFGFTIEEKHRIERFEENNPELTTDWILIEHNYTREACYEAIEEAGIELPKMYQLGYNNNNCIGCVKASSARYWNKIRRDFPDYFRLRAEQSRKYGFRLTHYKGTRIFLDELPKNYFPKEPRQRISCGPDCGNLGNGENYPFIIPYNGKWSEDFEGPELTVLNYSGGRQSTALLWLLIEGVIKRPDPLIILNADPGMERLSTYVHNDQMREISKKEGLEIITVPGPDLYHDILTLGDNGINRIDNPPYWLKTPKGRGKLTQGCTYFYKIAPMDRYMRQWMEDNLGISSKKRKGLKKSMVHKWIGFGVDEIHRIKPPRPKYVAFRYPLIELGWDSNKVDEYLREKEEQYGIPVPRRSMCNGCFAHGLSSLKDMHDNQPIAWIQARNVDDAIKGWKDIPDMSVDRELYVSSSLVSLRELAKIGFDSNKIDKVVEGEDLSCDSGYCFL